MTRFAPLWEQVPSYSASQDRRLIGALYPSAAVVGMAVSVSAGMVLNVAAGTVAIPTPNNTGTTLCTSDATEQVTLPAAPSAGNNRIDLVVALARGNDLDGGSNNDWVIQAVSGAVAASPTPPATPAGAVALAQVYVTGGAGAITAGNITDVRPGQQLAVPLPQNQIPHTALVRVTPTAATSITGNVYVDWPPSGAAGPLSVPGFKKYADATRIQVRMIGTGYVTNTTSHRITFGFFCTDINTDREIMRSMQNDPASAFHRNVAGEVQVNGMPAGTYDFTGRCKTDAAAGTIAWATDTQDSWTLAVTETYQ